MLVDCHCHVTKDDNINEIISNMDNGIIVISGVDDNSNNEIIELTNEYSNVYGTIGIHPENLDDITDVSFDIIEKNINNKKIVGIGEIGLDYHYRKDNKEQQKEIFIKQLDLARKYKKAVVVHSRDAIGDTYDILKKYSDLKIYIHCFSGSIEMAKKFIGLGAILGVGGIVTFKNAKEIVDIVKHLDLINFVIETDSPYLSPEPLRGSKNTPSNVKYILKNISNIKEISLDEVINITNQNAIRLFDLNL